MIHQKQFLFAASVAFLLAACGSGGGTDKCAGVKCPSGQTCNASTGVCVSGAGGGTGGSAGGGAGGGSAGGGAGGGSAGGGAGGGAAGGGAGGGAAGGGAGGGGPVGGPGDTCQDAGTVITATTNITGQTTVGYTNNYTDAGTNCGYSPMAGPDRVYEVLVPAGQRLTGTVTPGAMADLGIDFVAGPAAQCDALPARTCLSGDDDDGDGVAETAQYLNSGAAAQTVFVIIDSYQTAAAGTFSLSLTLAAPPTGDACGTATALTAGTPITGETLALFGNDYTGVGVGCAVPNTGSDRAYTISVGAGQRLNVTVTPSATLDTSISLAGSVANCTARSCLASGNSVGGGVADTAQWVNTSGSAATVLVVVDTVDLSPAGTFTISATLDTPPSTGDVCASPDALPNDGGVVNGTTVGYTNNYSGGTNCGTANGGPDRIYSVDIPAGQLLTVVATPTVTTDAGFDPALAIVATPAANCDPQADGGPRVCLANGNTAGAGAADTVRRANGGAVAETVYLIVDSALTAGGTYTLSAVVSQPPPGDTCQTSGTAITASTNLTMQSTVGYTDNYSTASSTNCGYPTMPGPDRSYEVTLAAGQRIVATVQPDAGYDIGIDLVAGPASNCDTSPRACLTGDDNGAGGDAESISYTNKTAAAQTVFVVIDSFSTGAAGSGLYDLNIVIDTPPPPPMGDVCGTATVIAASGTLMGQSTLGFYNDYAPTAANTTCTSDENAGLDRVYSVTLNAGQMLSVTATPANTTDDVSVYLISAPATNCTTMPTCLAGKDTGFNGTAETVTYTNSTGAMQTVFIVIDSYYPETSRPSVAYSLTVNIQ